MTSKFRVCIVGAGVSGLVTMKYLSQAGIEFDCFEKRSVSGGLWAYDPNEESPMYQNCHAVASKNFMNFSDAPMPEHYPDYLKHVHFKEYLAEYANRFGIGDKITYCTAVTSARPADNGKWCVETDKGESRTYD